MAPIILHRAPSFSNLPVYSRHFSTFQETSGVSNGHEGLALLTTIVEGGGNCNPASNPSPNQSLLSTSLIDKIIHLIDALDLPCQRSYVALDQLLLDTLEALNIAYPKFLSGLSAHHNTSSIQQGLVHLHEILKLVQDFHGEHKQFGNSESDKHTSTVNQSSMEISKNSTATWHEDLPERRSLPPVLCRPRSPANREISGDPSAIAAIAGITCKDGITVKNNMEQSIHGEVESSCSNQAGEIAAESKPMPPSTPTGDYSTVLQTTPSSLSAPPPSPIPVEGLPMLLLSWDTMQDTNLTVAMVTPPADEPPVNSTASPSVAQRDTMSIAMDDNGKDGRTISMSAGEGNAPPPPPPLPPPTQPADAVEAVAIVPAPARGPPPPPGGGGNIAKALRTKKAATKLKRSTQMGSMYRHLRDRVEGGGGGGGVSRPHDKKARASPAAAGAMADALAEMTKRSAYFRQIEDDVTTHATTILNLKDAIGAFQSNDMGEIARFHGHVERQLACLTDETQVRGKKLETMRMAAALSAKLDGVVATLKGWKLQAASPVSPQLDRVEAYFNKIKDEVDTMERSKEEETKRFVSHNVHFDFGVLVRIKECMVNLSSTCVELALKDERADRLTATLAHEIEERPL
uniref:Uncharacterized protein n=1 Tax=Leersia perrieri TaxID=77586 RepID=A0A0D9VMC9_9ORYZ